jgi:hypothetical protein
MIELLQDRLAQRGGSGIYRLAGRTSARTVAGLVGAAGWRFLHLDGSDVDAKAEFLAAAAAALDFPAWAGRNWDAFEELVNDLSWWPDAAGRVLLLDRLGRFAGRQPGELRTAVEILETALAQRAGRGDQPLVILLRGAGPAAAHLPPLAVGPS